MSDAPPTREEIAKILYETEEHLRDADEGLRVWTLWEHQTSPRERRIFGKMADALLAHLRPGWEQAEREIQNLRDERDVNNTNWHDAEDRVNALRAREARLREALEEAWAEVHAEHGDINSPQWVSLQHCAESSCVRTRAALAEPTG